MSLHVGYVLKRFPRLSETFILNELLELEHQGVRITVFSLLKPPAEPLHDGLARLEAEIVYLPGGSALDAWQVRTGELAALAKRRVDSYLSASQSPLFAGKDGHAIAGLQLKAATVAGIAQACGIDHLHAHFGSDATTVALLAARQMATGFSYTAHARDIFHLYDTPASDRAMRQAKLAEAAFTVTVSDYNKRHLDDIAGTKGNVVRLYNGIDLDRFRPRRSRGHGARFVAIGRLVSKKGTDTALRALARPELARACLEVIGDGPELQRLQALAGELGIAERVRFAGACTQDRVIAAMREASAMVMPCRIDPSGDRDALPTVLLEALAMGVPAIASDIVGIAEIVIHERTGLLVPPDDPEALAAALARLAAEPLLARRLAKLGRAHAEATFDVRRNVARLRELFESTVNKGVVDHADSLSVG